MWPPTMSSLDPHAAMAWPAEGANAGGGIPDAELPFSAGGCAVLGVTASHVFESKCRIHMSPRYLPPVGNQGHFRGAALGIPRTKPALKVFRAPCASRRQGTHWLGIVKGKSGEYMLD